MRAFPAKRLLKKFVEFRGDADKTRRRSRGIKAPDFWTPGSHQLPLPPRRIWQRLCAKLSNGSPALTRSQRKITRKFPTESRASSKIEVQKLKDPRRIFDFTLRT